MKTADQLVKTLLETNGATRFSVPNRLPRLELKTFEDLTGCRIVGNHYHDQPLLDALDTFISNQANPIEQRAQACRKYDEAMGLDTPEMDDAALVADYVQGFVGAGDDDHDQMDHNGNE